MTYEYIHIYPYIMCSRTHFIYICTYLSMFMKNFYQDITVHVKCKNNKNINYMLSFLIHKVLFSTKFLIFEIFLKLSFRNNYFSSLLDNKGSKSSSSNANRSSRVADPYSKMPEHSKRALWRRGAMF